MMIIFANLFQNTIMFNKVISQILKVPQTHTGKEVTLYALPPLSWWGQKQYYQTKRTKVMYQQTHKHLSVPASQYLWLSHKIMQVNIKFTQTTHLFHSCPTSTAGLSRRWLQRAGNHRGLRGVACWTLLGTFPIVLHVWTPAKQKKKPQSSVAQNFKGQLR